MNGVYSNDVHLTFLYRVKKKRTNEISYGLISEINRIESVKQTIPIPIFRF